MNLMFQSVTLRQVPLLYIVSNVTGKQILELLILCTVPPPSLVIPTHRW